MVKIRLAKGGVKNKPYYRIVAIDEQRKREGRALDTLGYWYPVRGDFKIDEKKLKDWLARGAQMSPAVRRLIKEQK